MCECAHITIRLEKWWGASLEEEKAHLQGVDKHAGSILKSVVSNAFGKSLVTPTLLGL